LKSELVIRSKYFSKNKGDKRKEKKKRKKRKKNCSEIQTRNRKSAKKPNRDNGEK
jgi:hypothetical protein